MARMRLIRSSASWMSLSRIAARVSMWAVRRRTIASNSTMALVGSLSNMRVGSEVIGGLFFKREARDRKEAARDSVVAFSRMSLMSSRG